MPSSSSVTSRVESVWSARWIRSNISRVLPMRSAGLVLFSGGGTLTLGLGFFDHSRALAMRRSSSRTLVKYSSTFSRSRVPRVAPDLSRLLANGVEDAEAVFQSLSLFLHFIRRALHEQPSEDRRWKQIRGHHRPAAQSMKGLSPLRLEVRLAKQSRWPILSAANWSREMLLRKPARFSGCTAAVRKLS